MEEGDMHLRTINLAVGYDDVPKPIHTKINVCVKSGEFTCLLGPNGAGKSTLIKTLSGFIKPISGEVWYGNSDLSNLSEAQLSKIVSVVLTDKLIIQNLTVFELVALGRTPYTGFFGRLLNNDKEIIHHAIEEVGLGMHIHKSIDKISDGERQKAMIAKALVQETPFIILDEPAAFLDLPAKIEIMQLLRRLSKDKKRGILLSTHDLEMALQIADKIWLLNQDKDIQVGVPEDLVLSNDFKLFFEREGIVFDNSTGTFKYNKLKRIPVSIKGNGDALVWMKRALIRLGFEPVDNITEWRIEVSSNGVNTYKLFNNNCQIIQSTTIELLLDKMIEQMNGLPILQKNN